MAATVPVPDLPTSKVAQSVHDNSELVARIRDGDSVAFEIVVRRYFDSLYRFVYGYVHAREEAEEVLQETFFQFWEHRTTLRIPENGSLQSYLFRAVRNRVTDVARHDRVERGYAAQVTAADGDLVVPDVSTQYEAQEFVEALQAAVDKLPERTRQAYTLYHQHGLSYAEVAEVMEISVKGVEFQLGKAMRFLREALQRFAP
jgi:RNA polymerase sigma-70 factor (ECF subfamily)